MELGIFRFMWMDGEQVVGELKIGELEKTEPEKKWARKKWWAPYVFVKEFHATSCEFAESSVVSEFPESPQGLLSELILYQQVQL